MLDIKDKNGNLIDFVTGDHILDMKTFQERNPQDEMIEKIELLWADDYISFDQGALHYDVAMKWERGEGADCPVKGGVPFEEFPRRVNWLALTLYNEEYAAPEDYKKYERLYEEKYFKSLIDGLNEMFGVSNIFEHTALFQLFLAPAAPQFALRDEYDLQCEHSSVQVEEDWTPREIGRSVESDRWKYWTADKWRADQEKEATPGTHLYSYHHDPYNFFWFRLDKSKRLITRNIERDNIVIKSNSVISMDGWMHGPDPSSWGISMRLSLQASFWETKNHTSEICKKLIEHVRSYRYIPIYPDHHYERHVTMPPDFIDYSIKDDNKEFLDNEEYNVNNWQDSWWWDQEEGKLFLNTAKEWLKKKR